MRMRLSAKVGETGVHCVANWDGSTGLYDLKTDPGQMNPIDNTKIIDQLTEMIITELTRHDAPEEIYEHYGFEAPSSAALSSAMAE